LEIGNLSRRKPRPGAILIALAGLAAAGGVAAAAFAPLLHSTTYGAEGVVLARRDYSLYEDGIGWETGLVLGWFALCACLMLVFAFVAWRGGGQRWLGQAVLVLGFLLTASALFLALTVGWLLLPAAVLSLLGAALWTWAPGREHPTHSRG
jgi:L-lactate permease